MSRSSNGTRMIRGREFLQAGSWQVLIDTDLEYVHKQIEALRRSWNIVKLRCRNGWEYTAWVHGAKQ